MDKQQIFTDIHGLCEGFTKFFVQLADNKSGTFYMAISGGTTPIALFNYWADNLKESHIWQKVHFFWVDERCVPPDSNESNFYNAKKHLLDKLKINPDQVYRMKGEESPQKEAGNYASLLQEKLPLKNNTPHFDLIILGMGNDGHTASIFPHQIKLWDENSNCVVGEHPETGQKRVSLTGKVINNAKHVAFLLTGTNKKNIVAGILDEREYVKDKYPAALVNPVSGNLFWFMDSEAAHLIMHE
ncbi:MAG: 6-phosphogluconolactonase [Bacteroidetes bacterium]|jgi:6-phosphogluconolactonase|nr:6-phosphogluconolactonase [Bacteroidota bacterium]